MEKAKPFPALDVFWRFFPYAVALTWAGTIIGLAAKVLAKPDRPTNTSRFLRAGLDWIAGDALYDDRPNKGFVYGPFSAVCYAATTYVPEVAAHIIWILVSSALLLGGLWLVLHKGPFANLSVRWRAAVFLMAFPLSLGNLDAAQANPIIIGCVMIAIAAAFLERWTLAALAVAVAVHWKVYPIVVGMLLVLVSPWKFTWRLVLWVVLMGLAPYLFQKAAYVSGQYALWYDTRMADNRMDQTGYPLNIAPRDLWFLLVRVMEWPLNLTVYRVLQAGTGALIAVFVICGRWQAWPKERLLGGLFLFGCVWMILFGPASEMHAYLLVAPAAGLAVAESFSRGMKTGLKVLAGLAYFCLLLALLRVAFVSKFEPGWILAIQPVGALFLLGYGLWRYLGQTGECPVEASISR